MKRTISLLLTLVFTVSLRAAIPPLRAERLREMAQVIVTGEILSYTSEEKTRRNGAVDTHYTVRVKVKAIEKGAVPLTGKTIAVHGWSVRSVPTGMTGPTGNHTIDYRHSLREVLRISKGERVTVRLFLVGEKESYSILSPNGMEVLSPDLTKR